MFLLNQGTLPPMDPNLQKIKKSVKAKDSYGPVLERVKNNNIIKVQNENENIDPPPPGDESFGGNNSTAVIPYNSIQNNNIVTTQTNSGGNANNLTLHMPQKKNTFYGKTKVACTMEII